MNERAKIRKIRPFQLAYIAHMIRKNIITSQRRCSHIQSVLAKATLCIGFSAVLVCVCVYQHNILSGWVCLPLFGCWLIVRIRSVHMNLGAYVCVCTARSMSAAIDAQRSNACAVRMCILFSVEYVAGYYTYEYK